MSKDNSEYLIERYDNVYEVVIGLEVHAQVTSNSKLFSSSSTKFGAEPNTQVSLVDAAFPGMLPVINEYCVKQAIKTGTIKVPPPIPNKPASKPENTPSEIKISISSIIEGLYQSRHTSYHLKLFYKHLF